MSLTSDPATSPSRTLRRLGHLPVVPTAYANRAQATEAMEPLRAAVTRQGYEDGYAAGRDEALAQMAQGRDEESRRVASALSSLHKAVTALQETETSLRAELHAAAPGLAYALLETLLGREAQLMTEPVREAIARALSLDDTTRPVVLRLNPVDVGTLDELGLARDTVIVRDPAVEPGGARVEIDEAMLDGQLSTALERVRDVLLGPEAPEAPQEGPGRAS
jgi:flagellar assembly protein FliH